jgi:DNA-3-methyladenine glycosylase II
LQALAVLSLDVDATGWPDVGARDQVMGDLQRRYRFVRPVLFPTPYEAAAHFVLGHRRSAAQARRLRTALGDSHGDPVNIGSQVLHAFPRPQVLAKVAAFPGVETPRLERLHAIRTGYYGLSDATPPARVLEIGER